MLRHGKALGGWGEAAQSFLTAADIAQEDGVLTGDRSEAVLEGLSSLLTGHRVLSRF